MDTTAPANSNTTATEHKKPFLRFANHEKQPGHNNGEAHPDGPRRHVRRKKAGRIAKHVLHDILAMSGELIGTFLFLFIAFMGAQSANYNNRGGQTDQSVTTQDNQTILFIALSFGMSLIVVAWACFRITGSAFNPAVTLALWLIGGMTWRRAIMVTAAQMVGGIAAAAVAKALSLSAFAVNNALAPGLLPRNGMAIEMLTTALLVFTVLMTAAEKSKSTFLAPVAIGLALFVGHLASIGWTGAGINPARTFGPSVVTGAFQSYAWVYYVGQFLGTVIAVLAYVTLKSLGYEEVVGGGAIESENAEDSADVSGAPIMQTLATARNAVPIPGFIGVDDDRASVATSANTDLEAGQRTPGQELEQDQRGSGETAVNGGQHQPKWINKEAN